MTKFHITVTGDAAPCTATQKACPRGGADDHYATAADARRAAEEKLSNEFFAASVAYAKHYEEHEAALETLVSGEADDLAHEEDDEDEDTPTAQDEVFALWHNRANQPDLGGYECDWMDSNDAAEWAWQVEGIEDDLASMRRDLADLEDSAPGVEDWSLEAEHHEAMLKNTRRYIDGFESLLDAVQTVGRKRGLLAQEESA